MAKSDTEQRRRLENHVGLAIRKRRRELAISQAQLADRMNTTLEIISNYELGVTPVRADDMPRFAEVLNLPLSDFFPALSAKEPRSINEIVEMTEADSEERALAIHKFLLDHGSEEASSFMQSWQKQKRGPQQQYVMNQGGNFVPASQEEQYDAPWIACDPTAEFVRKYEQLDEGTQVVAHKIMDTLLEDLSNRQRQTKQIR